LFFNFLNFEKKINNIKGLQRQRGRTEVKKRLERGRKGN
jgi:hypothetical protein